MSYPIGKFVVSAYYHQSETTYAFGPFTGKQLEKFLKDDPHPEQHEEWDVMYVNQPTRYGTGDEMSAY